ncbi:MAG: hypothetical protein KatS3mg008_1722 [Acidimicrobiales bacterium]|nr:MAG: hypothetical protein KatS3mg008_1722 [Acidimicrobiales bacterium]
MKGRALRKSLALAAIFAAAVASVASSDSEVQDIGGGEAAETTATDTGKGGAGGEGSGGEQDDSGAKAGGKADAEKAKDLTTVAGMTSTVDSIGTRYTSAGALVTNPNGSLAAYDVEVLFNLKSADGKVLDSESANVPYIPAGATVPVAPLQIGFDISEEPATVEVRVTGKFAEDTGWKGVGFSIDKGIDLQVTDAAIVDGSIGKELTAQVTNPSDQVAEMATWHCVFKRGGTVVGGASSGIADRIPPKGTVALREMLSVDLTADEVVCRAYA